MKLNDKVIAITGAGGIICSGFVTGTVIPVDGGFSAYSGV